MVVVTVINRVLRLSLPNYTAAEQTLQFTLAMKWARLLMAIVTSLAAGAVTYWICPSSRWAPLMVGGVVLAMFLPVHIAIWNRFPAWYHLTFLLTIVPAVLVGALVPQRRKKEFREVYSAARRSFNDSGPIYGAIQYRNQQCNREFRLGSSAFCWQFQGLRKSLDRSALRREFARGTSREVKQPIVP